MYADMYMTQEVQSINLGHADFYDMGIQVKRNKESKRMMFFKLVHHNLRDKRREVYLMGVHEDQVAKWENSLEPSDEIKDIDRTYNIIKSKLLRAVRDHIKSHHLNLRKTDLYMGDPESHLDFENWEDQPTLNEGDAS